MTRQKTDARVAPMNRFLLILSLIFVVSSAHAARFEVLGLGPIFSVEISTRSGDTVASVTKRTFTHAQAAGLIDAFSFSDVGVDSITPPRQAPLEHYTEIVGPREFRAYGWCYSVDGVSPDLLADEYALSGSEGIIRWYFGYATRMDQTWELQCAPVFTP